MMKMFKCIICGKSCEHIETNAEASFFMRFVLTANLQLINAL